MAKEPMKSRVVRVSDEIWEAAKARANERGETVSEAVRKFLARYGRDPLPRPWPMQTIAQPAAEHSGHFKTWRNAGGMDVRAVCFICGVDANVLPVLSGGHDGDSDYFPTFIRRKTIVLTYCCADHWDRVMEDVCQEFGTAASGPPHIPEFIPGPPDPGSARAWPSVMNGLGVS